MNNDLIDIINEDNEVVDSATKNDVITKKLLHRSIKVVVINNKDEFLICKRPQDKEISNDKYEIGISGFVLTDETFEDAMFRELQKELNVDAPPVFVKKFIYEDEKIKALVHLYVLVYEEDLTVNKKEVMNSKFVPISKIEEMIDENEMSSMSEHIIINSLEEIKELSK